MSFTILRLQNELYSVKVRKKKELPFSSCLMAWKNLGKLNLASFRLSRDIFEREDISVI